MRQGERGGPGLPVPGRAAARRRPRSLLAAGPSLVLVTDGPHPARAFLPGAVLTTRSPSFAVADTIGAGDAFGGGFLAWWTAHGLGRADLKRPPLVRAAVQVGAAAVAVTCTRPGADPPTLVELKVAGAWPTPAANP